LLAANTAPSGSVPRDSSLPYRTESQMLVTWFGDRSQNDLFPFGRVLKKQGLLRTLPHRLRRHGSDKRQERIADIQITRPES